MGKRAYDPTLGRFLARDPLGRVPLFFADNPYVYAGNNPLSNVDPTGQYRAAGHGSAARESGAATNHMMARVVATGGCGQACKKRVHSEWVAYQTKLTNQRIAAAKGIANAAMAYFWGQAGTLFGLGVNLKPLMGSALIAGILKSAESWLGFKVLQLAERITPFTVGWAIENMAVITFDAIAVIAAVVFWSQTKQSDAYWHNPNNLASTEGWFEFSLALIGILLTGLSLVVMAVAPDASPIFVGFTIGVDFAVFEFLPKFRAYIDEEQRALGYSQS